MGALVMVIAGGVILYVIVADCRKKSTDKKDEYCKMPSRYNNTEQFFSDEADRRKQV